MGIGGLATVAAHHLGSYIELLAQAAGEYRASFLKRVLLGAGALVLAISTVVAGWATGLALLWDTPWRLPYCIGSTLFCLLAALTLAGLAVRRATPGPNSRTLRNEAAQDLALLQEWRRAQ